MSHIARLAVASIASGLALCAQAGTVLQPVSATSSVGSFSAQYLPIYAIDQSALSSLYLSGITDFDAFVTSTNTTPAAGGSFNTWYTPAGVLTGNFDFFLGSSTTIESLGLWNDPQSALQGVNAFNLLADDNAAFSSPTLLGSYLAAGGLGSANFGQVFSFAPTQALYVRMEILSNQGSTFVTGFTEAAFEVSAVPEPASYAMLLAGLGVAGLVARRRRRA